MDKKTIVATVVLSLFIIALAVALALSVLYLMPTNSKDKPVDNSLVMQGKEANGISLAMMPVSSVSSTNTYTITATIVPGDAANQKVKWTMEWSEPESTWASGKNVQDYVTLSVDNSTKIGTITCKQAFGTQIIVKAISDENAEINATCTLDYAQKITGATLNFGNVNVVLGGTTNIKFEIAPGVQGMGGTVKANYTTTDVYSLEENFKVSVKFVPKDGYFALKGSTITGAGQDYDVEFLGKNIYYDYDNAIKDWFIAQRNGDILFKNLSTAQIADYFSNITVSSLDKVEFTITGEHSSYTYNSTIKCTGYTNNTKVSAIIVDKTGYVF